MLLSGISVLVVEDEALIAMEIELAIEDAGGSIAGSIETVNEGIRVAQNTIIDVAILDIDLAGEDSFPIADVLIERGVPFIFHTGHGERHELSSLYPGILVCTKPAGIDCLLDALSNLSQLSR